MQPVTEAMQLFRHQRAVRDFAGRPVDDATLRQVLEAAIHAPSGSNTQPWKFIVVRDRAVREALDAEYAEVQRARGNAPSGPGVMAKAPVLIVPCVRVPDRTGQAGFQTGASIYPACQNLMLAARALGLGTVLTTSHRARREQVHALLGIPEGWESAAIIPLGWPDRAYGPNHRAPVDQAICFDHWAE
ncbi:MAG: nitroreductase family protein [Dehalococcoidia bacterium]